MKRRSFLKNAGIVAVAGAGLRPGKVLATGKGKQLQRNLKGKRVAIIGGGIAGMTAAHELAERGFKVTVYESKEIPGGKARSFGKPGTATANRMNLPGEHGFRYFPGFYRHITNMMKRTPFGNNSNGCLDNLVHGKHLAILSSDRDPVYLPLKVPRSFEDFNEAVEVWINRHKLGLTAEEVKFFSAKLVRILTSCEARRQQELEKISWWDYIEADKQSEAFQKFLADGLTNLLVAMRPKDGSARTVGVILIQQILSLTRPFEEMDRVLNGPTNDVWIDPWMRHLKNLGVDYKLDCRISRLHFDGTKITGATLVEAGVFKELEADIFILAVPLDVANRIIDKEVRAADPQFTRMLELRDEWMVGLQFFLGEELEVAKGHMMYLDSPWALTSIHQGQFFKIPMDRYGKGNVKDVLSVDISDWNVKGVLYGKTAKECTREEIVQEVWAQLKQHLNRKEEVLKDENLVDWMLDPGIHFFPDGTVTNDEPLLINTRDSLKNRPDTKTNIKNLFLASDYVATYTDLATMEAAAEAAKRSVNAILDATGTRKKRCRLYKLREPALFDAAKWRDWIRFKQGKPHQSDQKIFVEQAVEQL